MQYQCGKQYKYQTIFNSLQETLNQVRHQGEEEVRNLKVHLEELEEHCNDYKLRRFEIRGIYLKYIRKSDYEVNN